MDYWWLLAILPLGTFKTSIEYNCLRDIICGLVGVDSCWIDWRSYLRSYILNPPLFLGCRKRVRNFG